MSHTRPAAAASSPNFQQIFNNALKSYEKRTKNNLLDHPLAAQLQACDSPSAVVLVLQQQVQELNQSRTNNERLTKWLDPTVNVLYSLSGALGEGVGLVCFNTWGHLRSVCSYGLQVFSPAKVIFAGVGVLLLVRILAHNTFAWATLTSRH
jgi:fungal STAND N-terminal Goodbye domain